MKLQHVPYKGNGPAMSDLLGGHIPMMFVPIPVALGNIKAGTLRGLAIGSAKRTNLLPDLPTLAESGVPGFEVALRYGLVAPTGTPPAVIARLNKELNAALAMEDVRKSSGNGRGRVRCRGRRRPMPPTSKRKKRSGAGW